MRGHVIAGTGFTYLDHGSYATVFADPSVGRVRRIFRRQPDRSRDHCHQVFDSEFQAYQLIQGEEHLRAVVPGFHGRPAPIAIVDAIGADVSALYWLDLAMELELISLPFQKVRSDPSQVSPGLIEAFRRLGVCHFSDASFARSPERLCLIDFSTDEIELVHSDIL